MCKLSIQNVENYNLVYQESSNIFFEKYIVIINEYIKHCLENIIIQDKTYYNYIIQKGINTINHVFNFLLLYTKNIDIIYHNCQKSYIYYVEFIGQIGQENHSFLQLNSNDATLFVYKKTIFDIPNNFIKNYSLTISDKKLLDNIDLLIKIHNILMFEYIETKSNDDILLFMSNELQNITQNLIKINNYDIKNGEDLNKLNIFFTIISHCNHNNLIELSEIVIKKIKIKNNCDVIKLKNILLYEKPENYNSITKYITNIFNKI